MGEAMGAEAHARKREGEVSSSFVPVAAIEVPVLTTSELFFNPSSCEDICLDMGMVRGLFDERTKRDLQRGRSVLDMRFPLAKKRFSAFAWNASAALSHEHDSYQKESSGSLQPLMEIPNCSVAGNLWC